MSLYLQCYLKLVEHKHVMVVPKCLRVHYTIRRDASSALTHIQGLFAAFLLPLPREVTGTTYEQTSLHFLGFACVASRDAMQSLED
jgi:hypothetical protein